MVTRDFIKPGATVIDVGQNVVTDAAEAEKIFAAFPEKLESFRKKGSVLVGDVHPDVVEVAGAFTPVPGGVGPLTIAMLMSNTVRAARMRRAARRIRQLRRPRRSRGEKLMLRVGLTGGMATGKSTVASMLRNHDCPVLDADTIGHELLEEGQDAYTEVLATFGASILDEHKTSIAPPSAKSSFADPEKLKILNAILHPRIQTRGPDWFAALERSTTRPKSPSSKPLFLSKSGFSKSLDQTIVCWCQPEQQLERMRERGLTEPRSATAHRRANAQRRKIRNSPTPPSTAPARFEDTERFVASTLAELRTVPPRPRP